MFNLLVFEIWKLKREERDPEKQKFQNGKMIKVKKKIF